MTERLSSAADAGANELSRDGYIAMLAEGTGLNEDAAAAARAEWSALASLVEPLFVLPGVAGGRNFRRGAVASASNSVSRTDTRSTPSVTLIATEVAAAVIGGEVPSGVGVEVILAGLGQTIGAAAFGLRVSDLHSSGDEPMFRMRTPQMVGELIKIVLNRARDGQHPIVPEHPEISALRARLTNGGLPPSASPAGGQPTRQTRMRQDSGFDKEQRRQAAKDLNAAAKGKASFDVLKEAEESQTIGRLAAMSADEFADGLMAGTLGGLGESLDPLTRTVLSLSLEHIPAGFGNVSSVVEHVKHALRRHVGAQFTSGKSGDEVTATLTRKVNYESHETITFLEAIRIGYYGIDVAGSNRADPRAAISDVRAARLFEGSPMSTTEYAMPVTALAVQLNTTGLCSYRPIFGGDVKDSTADADVLELAKRWYDAIHGTSSGLANFHAVVKGALRTVPFDDLKYAMFRAEYTFMIAKAKARLGRAVDPGDYYSVFPASTGAAAEPGRHVLSAVLQTLKDEAHALLLDRQKVGEIAAEMKGQIAAQVQEQVRAHAAQMQEQIRAHMERSGVSTSTPKVSGASANHQAFTELKREFGALGEAMDDLKGKRSRIDEPDESEEPDADELDAEMFLTPEDSLCWKHLSDKGCTNTSCRFIHIDQKGMGWCPSDQQVSLLRSRIQALPDVKWDWGKIRSYELDEDIFS